MIAAAVSRVAAVVRSTTLGVNDLVPPCRRAQVASVANEEGALVKKPGEHEIVTSKAKNGIRMTKDSSVSADVIHACVEHCHVVAKVLIAVQRVDK